MPAIYTTKATIYAKSPTDTNAYGDEIDTFNISADDVRAHIYEEVKRVFNPSDSSLLVQSVFKALVPPNTDISKGDRLKDLSNEEVWAVDDVDTYTNFVMSMPKRLTLSRTA